MTKHSFSQIEFETEMEATIQAFKGQESSCLLLDDPLNRYSFAWNDVMNDVRDIDVQQAFQQPLAVLGRMVEAGRLSTFRQYLDAMYRVLYMTGLHYRMGAYRHFQPRLKRRGTSSAELPMLFVRLDKLLNNIPSREETPSSGLDRAEMAKLVLSAVRGLGSLRFAVYRGVRRHEAIVGTRYRAFLSVASRAATDERGCVKAIRLHGPSMTEKPSPRLIRQIRRLFLEADAYIRAQF